MSLPNIKRGSEEAIFKVRTSTEGAGYAPIGSKMVVEDGRTFRWTEAGSTALVVARSHQSEIPVTANQANQAIDTLTASDNVFILTGIGSTNVSFGANDLKDGYVHIDSAANLNPLWQIVSNTAITASAATGTITIGTKLVDDVASGEQVSFCKNPWKDVIIAASAPTAMPVGVSVVVVAANGFGWLATGGAVRCLVDDAVLEGDQVVTSVNTDGALMNEAAGETDGPHMGYVIIDQPSTETALIYLTFDAR